MLSKVTDVPAETSLVAFESKIIGRYEHTDCQT